MSYSPLSNDHLDLLHDVRPPTEHELKVLLKQARRGNALAEAFHKCLSVEPDDRLRGGFWDGCLDAYQSYLGDESEAPG